MVKVTVAGEKLSVVATFVFRRGGGSNFRTDLELDKKFLHGVINRNTLGTLINRICSKRIKIKLCR